MYFKMCKMVSEDPPKQGQGNGQGGGKSDGGKYIPLENK